jgi:hypothetical protein
VSYCNEKCSGCISLKHCLQPAACEERITALKNTPAKVYRVSDGKPVQTNAYDASAMISSREFCTWLNLSDFNKPHYNY